MKTLFRFLTALGASALALYLADKYIPGATITTDLKEFLYAALLLTLANVLVRPIARFVLSPIILLTLGLFSIVINAVILYAVDFYASGITISGLTALILTSVLVSVVATIFRKITKVLTK